MRGKGAAAPSGFEIFAIFSAKKEFTSLEKPCCMLIGACDELFIPEKIINYQRYAQKVADSSMFRIMPNATHLSIVIEAPYLIGEWMQRFTIKQE